MTFDGDVGWLVAKLDMYPGSFEKAVEDSFYDWTGESRSEIRAAIDAWKKANPEKAAAARKRELHIEPSALTADQKVRIAKTQKQIKILTKKQ